MFHIYRTVELNRPPTLTTFHNIIKTKDGTHAIQCLTVRLGFSHLVSRCHRDGARSDVQYFYVVGVELSIDDKSFDLPEGASSADWPDINRDRHRAGSHVRCHLAALLTTGQYHRGSRRRRHLAAPERPTRCWWRMNRAM